VSGGELDANSDYIKASPYTKCSIDQAEEITDIITVHQIYGSKTDATVKDVDGSLHRIYFGSYCSNLRGYLRQNIYIFKYGRQISRGDLVYLPRNENRCVLTFVNNITQEKEEADPTLADISKQATDPMPVETISSAGDIRRPTPVKNVRAIPTSNAAYLYWRPAVDNIAVDHYIVSVSRFHIETKDAEFSSMPNRMISKKTSFKVENLQAEELYFFYVVAVDVAGNISSDWSTEVSTTPRGSIRVVNRIGTPELRITKSTETARSILFRWNRATNVSRQTVILEVDGERDFASPEWHKTYIWIAKKDYRKGKPLKLIVRTSSVSNALGEDEYEFDF